MRDYKTLKVWEKAHRLTLATYRATNSFPGEERYGLIGQLRRAAVSMTSNIAEGCGRRGDREFARFLYMAMGSASELEYLILLVRDLGWLNPSAYDDLQATTVEVKRMLAALVQKLTAES